MKFFFEDKDPNFQTNRIIIVLYQINFTYMVYRESNSEAIGTHSSLRPPVLLH